MLSKIRNLISDITGPSLFDRTPYIIFVIPVELLISVMANTVVFDFSHLAIGVMANAIAFLTCWGLVEICDRYFFAGRSESPARLVWVLIASAIIGAVKGAVTLGCYISFELLTVDSADLVGRIAQTTFLGLIFIPGMAVLSATRSRFQTEHEVLIAERMRASSQEQTGSVLKGAGPSNFGDESGRCRLLAFVVEAKLRLLNISSNQSAALIRELIETRLRPMSHHLWGLENKRVPNFSYLNLSKIAMTRQAYAAGPVAAMVLLGYIGPIIAIVGLGQGLLRALILALMFWVGYAVAKLIRPIGLAPSVVYFIFTHSLLLLAYFWFMERLFGPIDGVDLLASFLALLFWIPYSAFLVNLISGALASRDGIHDRLMQVSSMKNLDSRAEKSAALLANRDLANYMHGYLQNNLLASAVRLEQNERDGKSLLDELTKVERLLTDSLVEVGQVPASAISLSLDDQLSAIAKQWTGYVAISITNKVVGLLGNQAWQISQVVSEGVSNAVRHGHASQIQIAVDVTRDSKVLITIVDDGLGPLAGTKGLGSSFFDSIAGSNWSLTAGENGGSTVRLAMSL